MKTGLFASSAIALFLTAAAAGAQSLSFGVGLTSNYMSRGMTQSNNGVALQPWAEYENSGFYAGVWASNVDFGGPDNVEIDLYGGYRWSTGDTNFDIGYARYFYDSTGDAGGEAYLLVDHTIGEGASAFAGLYANLGGGVTLSDAHVGLSIPLFSGLSGSARLGVTPGNNVYADVGVSYDVSDSLSVDLRAYRSNSTGPQYVLSTAFSF